MIGHRAKRAAELTESGGNLLYIEIHANGLSVAPMVCRNSDSL